MFTSYFKFFPFILFLGYNLLQKKKLCKFSLFIFVGLTILSAIVILFL